ncbi:MAG: DNA replication and repair protein RecF [Ignavibacteria bacterium]|jgi:DNA replication and repair protein RecF
MILKTLELRNFRLHVDTKITFNDSLNFIIGGNGQGKTTILEAIYYLCTSKNINQSPDLEAVNFKERFFEIEGVFENITDHKNKILYSIDLNKKVYELDKKQVGRASAIIGKFPVVILTQSDHSITLGSPSYRRKFVDSVISQASDTYLKILLEYNKTLRQRSSLLNQIKENYSFNLIEELNAWSDSLVKLGTEIVKHRINFINEFNNYLFSSYRKIMEGVEEPKINYSFLDNSNLEKIESLFKEKLEEVRNQEMIRCTNLIGPHRDDFIFLINNYELKKYGSQGQHKTFQVALKFAEFFFLKDKIGKTPIFLMDDVFGDLDINRSKKISKYLNEIGQAFITLTDFGKIEKIVNKEKDLVLGIEEGKCTYA